MEKMQWHLGDLLLTWINCNPSMGIHVILSIIKYSMGGGGGDDVSTAKLLRRHRWGLGVEELII